MAEADGSAGAAIRSRACRTGRNQRSAASSRCSPHPGAAHPCLAGMTLKPRLRQISKAARISSSSRNEWVWRSHAGPPPVDHLCEPVEWAGYGPDRAIGDAGVKRRCVKLGMAQKCLDHANIDILLEEVRGKAVPQCVRRHALRDPRGLGGGADNAAELPGRQRLDRIAPWKQPASRQQQAAPTPLAPRGAQQFEQCGDSIAWRSLPPLPRSTRSSMRSESISPTLSATTF